MDAVAPISASGSGLLFSLFWSGFWNPQILQGFSPHGGRLCCLHFSLLTVTTSQCCGYIAMCTEKWKSELNGIIIISFSIIINYVIYNTPEQQNSNGTFMKAAYNFIVPSHISNLYLQPDYKIATLITMLHDLQMRWGMMISWTALNHAYCIASRYCMLL